MMHSLQARYYRIVGNKTFLFPLVLFFLVVAVNLYLQNNMLAPRVLNANLRSFTPLIFLAVGQTLVIIGGSIDLSIGTIMSLVAAVMVTRFTDEASTSQFLLIVLLGIGVGLLAGALNGLLVAFIRLPSFITTYAISYIYAGIALWILPRPGGTVPILIGRAYRALIPYGIPVGILLILILLLLWSFLRSTRFGTFLYAIGGYIRAAYTSGVPVERHRLATHMIAGAIAAFAALFFVLNTGSSDARIGQQLTLDSIVATVIGGTPLSGGIGGVAGSILGVLILGFIRNIVSFANVNSWFQPVVDASIILVALATPGLVNLIRRQFVNKY